MAKKSEISGLIVSGFGLAALGVGVLIVGSLLKSHFALNAAICNTYGGSTSHCSINETLYSFGQIMQPVGGIMIGLGLILGVLFVIIASAASKANGSPQASVTSGSRTQADPSARVIGTASPLAPRASVEELPPPVADKNDW